MCPIKQDPRESYNLIEQEPAKANGLQACLREWLAANSPLEGRGQDDAALEVELDEEIEERLRALGYIE